MKLSVSTDSLENKSVPAGIHEFVCAGMKFVHSKDRSSINFKPILKVIGSTTPELNGKPIFIDISQKAGWIQQDFVHSLGLEMEIDTATKQASFPGEIETNGAPTDPTKWTYKGPMEGRTGKVELKESSYLGKPQIKVKAFFCAVPGCSTKTPPVKHSTDLN